MTEKKEIRDGNTSDIDRLYNSYAADFSEITELSEKNFTAPSEKQADTFDDDLFDADSDDYEIDDYDEDDVQNDSGDFIIPADMFRDEAEEPIIPASHVQEAFPMVVSEPEKPARSDTSEKKESKDLPDPEIPKPIPSAKTEMQIKAPKAPKTVTRSQKKQTLNKSVKPERSATCEETPHTKTYDRPQKSAIIRGENKYIGAEAPYTSLPVSARSVSADFLPALLPILIWAVFVYGARVLAISAVSVISCVIFELWFEYLIRKRVTVSDLSAVSDGLLISLLMPASVPLWIPVVASFFGTVLMKCLLGGRGRSILQPSLAGFAFVSLIFRDAVTAFIKPLARLPFSMDESTLTELSAAYPLSDVSGQNLTDLSYTDMVIGLRAGSIGEISILLIVAALVYLLVRRVITWHVPVSFITVSGVLFYLLPRNPIIGKFTAIELLCGIIPLLAVFFASDFTVAPIFGTSKLIYGAGCGALTVLFRYLGLGIYSAVYAVLILNLFSRPLDMLFVARPRKKKHA